MNLIALTAFGAGVLAFGPGFLVQAAVGYVAGTFAGSYCENRMKRLHREICRTTGDGESDIDGLGKYAVKASQIGGVICPVVPLVSAGVGMYCAHKADKLRNGGYAEEARQSERGRSQGNPFMGSRPASAGARY